MNKKSGKIRLLAGLMTVACLFVASNVFALSTVLSADGGNWSANATWSLGTTPTSADKVFVRDNYSVTVNSDVGTITQAYIGDTGKSGTVNMTSGNLVSTSATEVGRRVSGATGSLLISGGKFSSGATGGTAILVGADLSSAALTTGLLEISGTGEFFGRAIIGSTGFGSSGDKLRIVGSDAIVGTTSTEGTASFEIRESGSVEWVFGATGASTVNVQEVFTFASGSAGIIVDGSAYTGGENTFTLLSAGVIGGTAPTIQLNGFAEGTTYEWNSTTDTFKVFTAVPEPATIGMLGLGALAMMGIRRFARRA